MWVSLNDGQRPTRHGLDQLQGLMGHEDLSTLREYLKLSESDFEEAHRKYGAVDNVL